MSKTITVNDLNALRDDQEALVRNWYNTLPDTKPDTPLPPPPEPGTRWLSGVADHGPMVKRWANFRSQPTTYARTWADADDNNMRNLFSLAEVTRDTYAGVLDLCIGGPSDWEGAARGTFDSTWAAQCRKALSLWGNLRQLHLSMAHEFNNIPGYRWSVSGNEQASFRKAWARWYKIVQEELVDKGKDAKVVLSCNSDTNGGWTLKDGLPDPDTFDIIGSDYYNFWPATPNQQAWDDLAHKYKGDVPRGIWAWINLAKSLGKPIQFGEWGCAPSGNFPVDDPFYIRMMHETFAKIAPADPYKPGPGQIAGEAYFNAWPRGTLHPTVSAPKVAKIYLELWRNLPT